MLSCRALPLVIGHLLTSDRALHLCKQLSKPSLKLAVAGVCRLLALNPAHAVQLAQVGIIPPLVQMVYNGPGQESGEVAAKALCNMSQHPLCRRIIARAGMNLLRQSSDSAALRTSRKANQGDIASTDIIPASEWHINIGPRYVQGDDPATIG